MQGSLFTESNIVKTPPPVRKKRRALKVKRSNKLKRHPSRPPVVKRIVKTKKVVLWWWLDGPQGDIIEKCEGFIMVQWPGKDEPSPHNPRFLRPVEDE